MSYQALDPRTMLPATDVIWGPFPLRWSRLIGGLFAVAMALGLILLGLQRNSVTCARSGALAGQCQWQTGILGRTVHHFPLAAVREVSVLHTETSSKGHTNHWGEVVLNIDGHPVKMSRQTAAIADQNAADLQAFLRDPALLEVRIDNGLVLILLGIGSVCALVGAALLYSVWAGRRRFHFTWDGSAQKLVMQLQTPLGTPSRAPVTWSLRDPIEVEILWEEVKDWFTSPRSPGPRGARLQVRQASGNTVDLVARPLPGYRVHIRAAEKLRDLLRCPPSAALAVARTASYEAARPRLGPGWTGITGRIAATWLGASSGSLIGLAISAGLAVLLGFAKPSDNAGGPWFFGGVVGGGVAGVALAWRVLLRPDER